MSDDILAEDSTVSTKYCPSYLDNQFWTSIPKIPVN